MTTELILATGTQDWAEVTHSVNDVVSDLLDQRVGRFTVALPHGGKRIEGARLNDGQVRLAAAGNDSLIGGNRLTVRDERAVFAVGFSVASASWGTFYWDWSAPVDAHSVASGVVRTMRDIYKAEPSDVEVTATI